MEGDRRLEDCDILPATHVINQTVPAKNTNHLIAELEKFKRSYGAANPALIRVLKTVGTARLKSGDEVIRLHETLLFLRAYPHSRRVLARVETILMAFEKRIVELDEDLSSDPEVSGIVGTSVTSNFSYQIVRWLAAKHRKQLSMDWDWFEEEDRFGATMPRFLPLLEEDAMVEAHVPYRDWLRAAAGAGELSWLVRQFESLNLSAKAKAELYDSLKLHVTWKFGRPMSRTGMKLPVRSVFFHDEPLIQRREVSLQAELASPPFAIERLSPAEGERVLDLARETSAVRYRELHGFTYGDPKRVLKTHLGRGVDVFVSGVPSENRLPLRAYHAALIFKNGVPVAYFEGLSLFERMESGFNLYYTFREGETAWLFARILRLMRQLLGVTVISIDPYQIGHENEEGIESGAFWFYRKLGFRPVRSELLKLAESEERKIARRKGYRTPAPTLRKLAAGHMLFDARAKISSNWDRFEVRNLGFAVQRRMASMFETDPRRIRDESTKEVARALKIDTRKWKAEQLRTLSDLALVLGSFRSLRQWPDEDKRLAARVIKAKAGADESTYLRLMQRHGRMRDALVRLGS